MSYPYLLLICLMMMLIIALVMYYLGTKISYNYILFNASVSIGSGVLFFLFKILITINTVGQIELILDIAITVLLTAVWLVTIVETITIDVMENGKRMKENLMAIPRMIKAIDTKTILKNMVSSIKTVNVKAMPLKIVKSVNIFAMKTKTFMVKNKFSLKIQKLISDLHKFRELNKRV